MPAHRMAALVCRSTVRVRLWIGADSSRLRLPVCPANRLAHAITALYAGIGACSETRPVKNRKSRCEACWWRLSAARHDHDVRCPAYRCLVVGVRLENGTRSRRFLNVSCVWRRCSHNHGAQRCNIAWSARVARCVMKHHIAASTNPFWQTWQRRANPMWSGGQHALKQFVLDRRLKHEFNQIGSA